MLILNTLHRKIGRTIFITILLLNLTVSIAWAERAISTTDREAANQRFRLEEQERRQNEQYKDVFLQPLKKEKQDLSLPEETPAFLITEIRLEGEYAAQFSWAQKILNKYSGSYIGVKGITSIAKFLTNAFIEHGYITTQIGVPQQDLSKGILHLTLLPGIIQNIRFEDSKTRGNWHNAFPTHPGEILNLRDLEQGIEQMQRLPSQEVTMQLVPGKSKGTSDVLISLKQTRPWRILQSVDNAGNKATGKIKAFTTCAFDNLLGLNDNLILGFNSDIEHQGQVKGTKGDNFSFSLPYGNTTLSILSSWYYSHQEIHGDSQVFQYSDNNRNLEVRMNQLMHRSQNSKTSLEFSLIKEKDRSYIDNTELLVQRQITTAAKLGLIYRQKTGNSLADVNLGFQWGVPWFGGGQTGVLTDADRSRYKLWLLNIDKTFPVNIGKYNAIYNVTLHGQYTKQHLYSSQYFSIGNRYTVRGFDGDQTLAAERGWYLRNELSFPTGSREWYVGLDCGQVNGFETEEISRGSLVGTVVGLRGGVKKMQYDVFVGCPLKKPDGLVAAKIALGFQLTYQY
ncbi:MAG: ShlB/FhaC/HecB family hemolysin secretion/activation protein [Pelosinus sp.]|nr:ShlB/FhaC/HecB family hemolysin secretion/activation protein [Pelosinus sp.]